MPTDALRRVARKLHYSSMIFPAELDAMRAALVDLRSETMGMTEDYAASLLQTVQIQIEMKKAKELMI
jgi:hypothetical protein